MPERDLDPPLADGAQDPLKTVELNHGERFVAVSRGCEMTVDSGDLELGQTGDILDEAGGMLAPDADPLHACVDFQVNLRPFSRRFALRGDVAGQLQRRDRDFKIMLNKLMDLISKHAAEHERGCRDSVPAQLDSFFKKSDPEIVRAEIGQRLSHFDHSVAVPVRLDDPHHPDVRPHLPPDPVEIVPEALQVDLGPCQSHIRQKIYSYRS